jgi:hypothetical protein
VDQCTARLKRAAVSPSVDGLVCSFGGPGCRASALSVEFLRVSPSTFGFEEKELQTGLDLELDRKSSR